MGCYKNGEREAGASTRKRKMGTKQTTGPRSSKDGYNKFNPGLSLILSKVFLFKNMELELTNLVLKLYLKPGLRLFGIS